MKEQTLVTALAAGGIISLVIVAYAQLAIAAVVTGKMAILTLTSVCAGDERLASPSSCRTFMRLDEHGLVNDAACSSETGAEHDACEYLFGIAQQKVDSCYDIGGLLHGGPFPVNTDEIAQHCAVLFGERDS